MVGSTNRYSRFVRFAKVVFPLLALGLLSTLFLFSRTLDPSQAIVFSDIDIEEIAREQILSSPKFSGVTSDGSEILVSAERAKPDPDDGRRLSAEDVKADLKTQAGVSYELTAERGIYDGATDTMSFSGGVNIETSDGYSLQTQSLTAGLSVTHLIAPTEITGTGPSGKIHAGQMSLSTTDDRQVLIFKNGVKLVYQP